WERSPPGRRQPLPGQRRPVVRGAPRGVRGGSSPYRPERAAPGRADSALGPAVVSRLWPWVPAAGDAAHLTKFARVPGQLCARQQSRSLRSAVLVQVVHRVLDGTNFLGILVADLDVEFFFERHDQLDQVE